jgi:pimeloyl-ACP methyl ester carboxylesterase
VCAALCLLFAVGCAQLPPPNEAALGAAPPYDYPFDNPWTATVLGTPAEFQVQLPATARIDRQNLRVFEDGEVPEGFWHNVRLHYSTLLQDHEAPLVFVIAGTGADDQSRHMLMLGQALHAAGMHVVLLPSPTHANFIVNASATHLPGYPESDAADLLNVMRLIDDRLRRSIDISRYYLTGYSLGGWNAAYVAKLDDEQAGLTRPGFKRPGFGFERVLLINPPLSVYHSVKEIDAMLERGLPDGIYGLDAFLNRALARLAAYPNADALNFQDPDFMIAAYRRMRPSEDQLATVIGLAFRLSAANLVLTSDVMTKAGYIFPRNRPFLSTTPMSNYLAVALRTSLLDYFDDMLADKYLGREPGRTRQDLLDRTSLSAIGEWLSRQDRIWLMTNRDDVILAPGDLDELLRLFGPRTRIFPNGGHMGNLQHRAVAAFITDYFSR